MLPSTEILVHISGPSRGADDARYRREVLGFLQFDVAERYTLLGQERPLLGQVAGTPAWAEKRAKSRLPDLHNRLPCSETPRSSKHAAPTLPWTAVKQTPHILIERTPTLPRPKTAPTPSTPAQAHPLRRSQSDSFQTPPSTIPDSQPTPPSPGPLEVSSSPYLKRPFASSSPSPTRGASPPSAKRPRLQRPSPPPPLDSQLESRPLAISSSPKPPSTKRLTRKAPSSSPPSEKPAGTARSPPPAAAAISPWIPSTATPNEIHPPPPKPSHAEFKTHVTYSLATIAEHLPLEKHFKPATRTRTPETWERGHWLVPIGRWPEEWKVEFWDYLTLFVGRGQAGFGVWCVRETIAEEDAIGGGAAAAKDGGEEEEDREARRRREEVVKVFCFGEVVGQVWLLLWMSSKRRIKKTGTRWVDAAGEAVLVMPVVEGREGLVG